MTYLVTVLVECEIEVDASSECAARSLAEGIALSEAYNAIGAEATDVMQMDDDEDADEDEGEDDDDEG